MPAKCSILTDSRKFRGVDQFAKIFDIKVINNRCFVNSNVEPNLFISELDIIPLISFDYKSIILKKTSQCLHITDSFGGKISIKSTSDPSLFSSVEIHVLCCGKHGFYSLIIFS